MRRGAVTVALSALVSLAILAGQGSGASARPAGVIVTKDARGDVASTAPITVIDRQAIDILSVRAVGSADLGLVVDVTFAGNFENAIGRGSLEEGAVGLILHPSTRNALSAGLVTDGAGPSGTLYRETKSTDVGSVRDGNQLWFFLDGPGYDKVKSVEVVSLLEPVDLLLPNPPGPTPGYIGPKLWDRFASVPPLDRSFAPADSSPLSCAALADFLASIDGVKPSAGAYGPGLRRLRAKANGLHGKCAAATPKLGATFAWSVFSPNEVAGAGTFTGPQTTLDGIRIVLPSGLAITNKLCPVQLPNAVISGNRIDCGGGTLMTNDPFKLNLQTLPVPPLNMGGQLYGDVNGTLVGPFPITGP